MGFFSNRTTGHLKLPILRPAGAGILVLCLAVVSVCGVGPAFGDASEEERGSGGSDDVLDLAFRFASRIPADPHVADRSKAQYNALSAVLEAGRLEEAKRKAGRILNWRRGVVYAEIAGRHLAVGETEQAERYLNFARQFRDRVEGFNSGWQKERITAAIGEAYADAGRFDEADRLVADLSPEAKSGVRMARLTAVDTLEAYRESMAVLEKMEASKFWEVQKAVAEAYIEILRTLGDAADEQQATAVRQGVYRLTKKLPVLQKCPLHVSLARAAFETGHERIGFDVLNETRSDFEGADLNARFDVGQLVLLAKAYQEVAGRPEVAAALLEQAAALLAGSDLLRPDEVRTNRELGSGYAVHGDTENAWRWYRNAINAAAGQVNGRPRFVMFSEICVSIAEAGLALSEDSASLLLKQLNRRVLSW